MSPTGDLACHPGMCPDLESNWWPFSSQDHAQPRAISVRAVPQLFYPLFYWWALGLLPYWAIVNNATMNIRVHIYFQIRVWISSDKYPEIEFLGHKVILFLIVWGTSILFSTVAAPVCILTNSAWGFPFFHILTNTCCLMNYWWYPFGRCEVIPHCGFSLHFSDD